MPGRHVDNQPFAGSIRYSLKRIGHPLVVPTRNEARPHRFHKLDEPSLTKLPLFHPLQLTKLRF